MQGGDISTYATHRVGIVFDGLMALCPEPTRAQRLLKRTPPFREWEWDDIVYRSLRAFFLKGYPAQLEIYTFQPFSHEIDSACSQRHIWPSQVIEFVHGPRELAAYTKANLDITEVLTANADWAAEIGPRARVCRPGAPLGY